MKPYRFLITSLANSAFPLSIAFYIGSLGIKGYGEFSSIYSKIAEDSNKTTNIF